MARQLLCTCCGQKLISNASHQFQNKTYCLACYTKIMEEHLNMEKTQSTLYDFIKETFHVADCPAETVGAIETLLKQGKTLNGIRATIYYYYNIMGHEANASSLMYISKIIKEQYDTARQYYMDQKKIRDKNMGVDLTPQVKTIVLKQSPKPKQKQLKYRMEDL